MTEIKIRKLKASEIELRVGRVIKTAKFSGVTLLLYKNARVDMAILDELFSPLGWKREHEVVNGNMYCTVSVFDRESGQWVSKQDCGTESNAEAEKGEASDSFKRACVNWGIGRELYTAPDIIVPCDLDDKGKPVSWIKWVVDYIEYNSDGDICELLILETNRKRESKVVFDWSKPSKASGNGSNLHAESENGKARGNTQPHGESAADGQIEGEKAKTFKKGYKCSVCGKAVHDECGAATAKKYGAWLCSPECIETHKKNMEGMPF